MSYLKETESGSECAGVARCLSGVFRLVLTATIAGGINGKGLMAVPSVVTSCEVGHWAGIHILLYASCHNECAVTDGALADDV